MKWVKLINCVWIIESVIGLFFYLIKLVIGVCLWVYIKVLISFC